jgi:hypothetical protein
MIDAGRTNIPQGITAEQLLSKKGAVTSIWIHSTPSRPSEDDFRAP